MNDIELNTHLRILSSHASNERFDEIGESFKDISSHVLFADALSSSTYLSAIFEWVQARQLVGISSAVNYLSFAYNQLKKNETIEKQAPKGSSSNKAESKEMYAVYFAFFGSLVNWIADRLGDSEELRKDLRRLPEKI